MDTSETNIRNYRTRTLPKIDFITKLHAKLEISYEWLFSDYYENEKESLALKDSVAEYKKNNLIPLYDTIHKTKETKKVTSEKNIATKPAPLAYINVGDWFPTAHAALRYYGSHMKEYPNGSILALKEIKDINLLSWGHNHVVVTTDGFYVKRIQKNENTLLLTGYSTNEEQSTDGKLIYAPQIFSLENMHSIYEIVGYVVK